MATDSRFSPIKRRKSSSSPTIRILAVVCDPFIVNHAIQVRNLRGRGDSPLLRTGALRNIWESSSEVRDTDRRILPERFHQTQMLPPGHVLAGTPEFRCYETATNMPTLEIASGLELCGRDRTRLQAFTVSSVCPLLHSGFSAPDEKTTDVLEEPGQL